MPLQMSFLITPNKSETYRGYVWIFHGNLTKDGSKTGGLWEISNPEHGRAIRYLKVEKFD